MIIYARIHTLLILPSRLTILILALLMGVGLSSCHSHDNERHIDRPEVPIAFASGVAEQEALTRATTPLAQDFTVYGYKLVSAGQVQTIFKGYEVKYLDGSANTSEDNTHGYSYVDVAKGQSIKYWDFNAQGYNFWGATKALVGDGGCGSFSDDGTVLTITGLTQSVTEPTALDGQLFSALYHRSPVTTDVVRLEFMRPYAKVRVLFYTNLGLSDKAFDNIEIKQIGFGPGASKKIITSGNLTVTYPKTEAGPMAYSTVASTSTQADNLSFYNVVLDHEHGTASNNTVTAVPTGGEEYYFVVPNDNASAFTLNAQIDGENKTAVVPAELMNWRPNVVYTYIFKIFSGKYIEFYDVKIEPWQFSGAQEEEWKNW